VLRPGLTGDTAGESRSDVDDHIIPGPGRQLTGVAVPTSGVRPHMNHRRSRSSRNLRIERGVRGAKGADRNCSLSPSGDGDDRDGPLADVDRGPVRVRPRWRERYGRMVDRRRSCRDHRRLSRTCPSRPARRPTTCVRQHAVVASVPRSDPRPAVLAPVLAAPHAARPGLTGSCSARSWSATCVLPESRRIRALLRAAGSSGLLCPRTRRNQLPRRGRKNRCR